MSLHLANSWIAHHRSGEGESKRRMVQREGASGEPSDVRSALAQFEALRSEFQVVLDGQKGVIDRVDRMEAEAEKRYGGLKKYLTDGLEKIYEDMRQVESRLAKVEAQR
jgi:hypothetical protein